MRETQRGVCADAISPLVEALESRQLLSASVFHAILKIGGTAGDDTITLSADRTRIIVNDGVKTSRFAKSIVKSISIVTGDGADNITVHSGIKQQITIKSGEGNDTVQGGSGREIIFGAGGDDSLSGGGGSDYLSGGTGNDHLDGGSGNDYIYGDEGDDVLLGGAGNDVMAGDLENTLVFSGTAPMSQGNDSLDGGDGNDWLIGERRVLSLPPNYVLAGDGQDTFTGGAGNDILDVGGDGDTITDKTSDDFVPSTDATHAMDPGPVHTHVLLKIQLKKGSRYRNVLLPDNIGYMPTFLAFLHTHVAEPGMPAGTIHFESPGPTAFKLIDFFKMWGTSLDSGAIGRFLAPAGKKVTMTVTRGSNTFSSTKLGNFVPVGSASTNVAAAGGDVITLRVG